MNGKKYILTDITMEYVGHKLYRIKAVKNFSNVHKGDLGGWIEDEDNLSQEGECWIYHNAKVFDNARLFGNARVGNEAEVYGNAQVFGNAIVFEHAKVRDNAIVYDNAIVLNNASVYNNARVHDNVTVCDDAAVFGNAIVSDNAEVCGNAKVFEYAKVRENVDVLGNAKVFGYVCVFGNAEICGDAEIKSKEDYAVFKNTWSSGRYFTWTRSNNMWRVGCFYGTGEELIAKAYKDGERTGKCYEIIVKAQEAILNII